MYVRLEQKFSRISYNNIRESKDKVLHMHSILALFMNHFCLSLNSEYISTCDGNQF